MLKLRLKRAIISLIKKGAIYFGSGGAKGNRKMSLSKEFLRQRGESLKRITSKTGILIRMNCSIQAEGAFGVVKQDYGFRQFLLCGNCTGSQLFEKDVT